MALECSFSALAELDQSDPEALQALLRVCTGELLNPLFWEWALGITIACALVGAFIGIAKGRWLAGLIWGAALGPIGWLVIALSKANLPECPECGRPNATHAKVCRHCGINLALAAQRSARSRLKRDDSGRSW
jgi:ribosomal protein L32